MLKKISILILFVVSLGVSYAQFERKANKALKKELGFLFYVDNNYISFASVKSNNLDTSFRLFSTENLNMAFQLGEKAISVDTLWQYALEAELLNYDLGSKSFLKIVPVKLIYQVNEYAMTKKQFKESTFVEVYSITCKKIRVKVIGGLPIKIVNVEPITTIGTHQVF